MNRGFRGLVYSLPGFVVGALAAHGCGAEEAKPAPIDIVDHFPCAFVCSEEGVADGNASISGTASVDAFFGSVIRLHASADAISVGIRSELDAIAASVGARAGDDPDLKAKLDAFVNANVTSLDARYQPVRCIVSTRAVIAAEAQCDPQLDLASAVAQCDGSCVTDPGMDADCGAGATVSCVGTAPDLRCDGTCEGDCELTTADICSGTCHGSCNGECTVKDTFDDCAGTCDGKCMGRCTLEAGATCSGLCAGECTNTPHSGTCDPTAQARCDAKQDTTIDCRGICAGHLTPPKANAECEARAEADASVDANCAPPTIDLVYQLSTGTAGDAMATASFQAWLEGFRRHASAILAYRERLDEVRRTAKDLGMNTQFAVRDSINGALRGKLTLKEVVGLGCAIDQLPAAFDLVEQSATNLTTSAKSAIDVLGAYVLFRSF